MGSTAQRQQLSEFLKNCRLRLSPGEVGLPALCRRRTGGLRREDVAALAGVSLTWYTWLEQGREVRLSTRVLESICSTLRLSGDERDYLFALVHNRPPPLAPARVVSVRPAVLRALDRLTLPAQILTARWDVVAWNRLVALTFRDYGRIPPEERNLLRILLTTKEYQDEPEAFEALARRVVARFRVDYSQAAGDPQFDLLVEDLLEASPMFRKVWHIQEIASRSEGLNFIHHPLVGRLTFEHTSYVVEGAPSLRLFLFVPHDANTEARFARLVAAHPPGQPIEPAMTMPAVTDVAEEADFPGEAAYDRHRFV